MIKPRLKVKEKSDESFEVTFTVKSEEELCGLWHRLNINNVSVIKVYDGVGGIDTLKHRPCEMTSLWQEIDREVISRGLKDEE